MTSASLPLSPFSLALSFLILHLIGLGSLFLPPNSTAKLLVDHSSLELLSGSTIDYATELIGSSFRVKGNPHASDKGGCGCGVSESFLLFHLERDEVGVTHFPWVRSQVGN